MQEPIHIKEVAVRVPSNGIGVDKVAAADETAMLLTP
jgi:hypothetical protein